MYKIILCALMLTLVWGEAVKKCLDEAKFGKAKCSDIREYLPGRWAEVRRMKLPFELFDDHDCVTHDIQPTLLNETHAVYRVVPRKNGTEVAGLSPFHIRLQELNGVCNVQLEYVKPGEETTRRVPDFWFKYYEKGDIMIGYTCTTNRNPKDKDRLPFRNLAFLYVKPQLPGANLHHLRMAFKNVRDDFIHLMDDIVEEGEDHISDLTNDSCHGW